MKKQNIPERTREIINLLTELREFDGINLDVTPESEKDWTEDCAKFTVDIVDFNMLENPSDDAGIEEDEFWYDLEEWLQSLYNNQDVNINIDRDSSLITVRK